MLLNMSMNTDNKARAGGKSPILKELGWLEMNTRADKTGNSYTRQWQEDNIHRDNVL